MEGLRHNRNVSSRDIIVSIAAEVNENNAVEAEKQHAELFPMGGAVASRAMGVVSDWKNDLSVNKPKRGPSLKDFKKKLADAKSNEEKILEARSYYNGWLDSFVVAEEGGSGKIVFEGNSPYIEIFSEKIALEERQKAKKAILHYQEQVEFNGDEGFSGFDPKPEENDPDLIKLDKTEFAALSYIYEYVGMKKDLLNSNLFLVKCIPGIYAIKFQKDLFDKRVKTYEFVCSLVRKISRVTSDKNDSRVFIFEYQDDKRQIKEMRISSALLERNEGELKEFLTRHGFRFSDDFAVVKRIFRYLEPCFDNKIADKTGWYDGEFVLVDQTISKSERPIYLYSKNEKSKVEVCGNYNEWKEKLAAPIEKNFFQAFGVAAAFAAPFSKIMNARFIAHFIGASSIGKTTIMNAAASVWGNGGEGCAGYIGTWNGTSNGFESVFSRANELLVCLDEIGQALPKVINDVAYMACNGEGKSTMTQGREFREANYWSVITLSTGEKTLASVLADGDIQAMAGQEVRILDINVDNNNGLGSFFDISGFENGGHFAQHIKRVSSQHYGHAGIEWLKYLVNNDIQDIAANLEKEIAVFIKKYLDDNAGSQVCRAARLFALIGAAGEEAIKAGILPWEKGASIRAAKVTMQKWIDSRASGLENKEDDFKGKFIDFLLSSSHKFQFVEDALKGEISNGELYGYQEINKEESYYYIIRSKFNNEICRELNFDKNSIKDKLAEKGMLLGKKEGKNPYGTSLRIGKTVPILYKIKLNGAEPKSF